MYIKKEMVEEICSRLNKWGFIDVSPFGEKMAYCASRGFGDGLMNMPFENVRMMFEYEPKDTSEFHKVYNEWGRIGALKFVPYIYCGTKGDTTLVLRHNRYLHMFRGYHFQASGTKSGIGSFGNGSYRVDYLTTAGDNQICRKSLLAYMLWWAAMVDVGFGFENFIELYNSDKAVINDFLCKTIKYWGGPEKFSYGDIEKYITMETGGHIDTVNRKTYELVEGNSVYAYMAIGEKTVQVETYGGKLVTIEVPDMAIGTEYDDDSYGAEEFECDVEWMKKHSRYTEILLVMACKLAGIMLNFHGFYMLYSKKGKTNMRHINKPGVVTVETLNEIYKAVPDEF